MTQLVPALFISNEDSTLEFRRPDLEVRAARQKRTAMDTISSHGRLNVIPIDSSVHFPQYEHTDNITPFYIYRYLVCICRRIAN